MNQFIVKCLKIQTCENMFFKTLVVITKLIQKYSEYLKKSNSFLNPFNYSYPLDADGKKFRPENENHKTVQKQK
jgi:hypothetical protein